MNGVEPKATTIIKITIIAEIIAAFLCLKRSQTFCANDKDGPAMFSLSCASSFGKGSKASAGRFNFSSVILSSRPRFHLI